MRAPSNHVHARPVPPGNPLRPIPAFRVGVTGTRDLRAHPGASEVQIRNQVRTVLIGFRDEVAVIQRDCGAQEIYAEETRPLLRLITPLAEGADRLVAEIGRDIGYEIEVVLPFPRAEYAQDFVASGSAADFDRWLGPEGTPDEHPHLALDGGRGDNETASYEAVGRLVVRNCDMLIAVWDGHSARGRGGTGDIVPFSLSFGIPVWWIDATGTSPPRLLRDRSDLRAPEQVLRDEQAAQALGRFVRDRVQPPHPHRHAHSLVGALLHRVFGPNEDPLHAFLRAQPLPPSSVWRLYGGVYRLLAGPRIHAGPEPVPVPDGPVAYWDCLYRPADRAASECADRYRSSYIWVFLLATLAVACAIAALAHEPWKLAATTIEVAILGSILVIVGVNERQDWHGRWIAYRLLAELCRKQGATAILGWSLPPADPRHAQLSDEHQPGEAWVGWYFDALMRTAPLPRGDLSTELLVSARDYVRITLIEEQLRYHEDRQIRSRRAGRRLVRLGEMTFLVTMVLVLLKLAFLLSVGRTSMGGYETFHGLIVGLGAAAAMLPAASAAFFAIRAYAELELLEKRSARMARLMAQAARRLDRLDLSRPLASQDLAAEIAEISTAMLQEVTGWADLFRAKSVEAS